MLLILGMLFVLGNLCGIGLVVLGCGRFALGRLFLGTLIRLNLGTRAAATTRLGRRLLLSDVFRRLLHGRLYGGTCRTRSRLCLGFLVRLYLGTRAAAAPGLWCFLWRGARCHGGRRRRLKRKLALCRTGILVLLLRSPAAPGIGLLFRRRLAIRRRSLSGGSLCKLVCLDLCARTTATPGLGRLLGNLRRGSTHKNRGRLVCHAVLPFTLTRDAWRAKPSCKLID